MTRKAVLSGSLPPPPAPDAAILIVAAPAPAETAEAALAKLPKTAIVLPLVGLAGALLLSLGPGLRGLRLTR